MHWRCFVASVLVLLLGVAGCSKPEKHPDEMNRAEFEAWLTKEHGLTDLAIKEQGPGHFTGTGKKDGKTWQIRVSRTDRQASWEIKHTSPNEIETKGKSRSW